MKRVAALVAGLVVLALLGCGSSVSPTYSGSSVPSSASTTPAQDTSSSVASSTPEVAVTPPQRVSLPPHKVASDTDISFAGVARRRIEIHVDDPDLTKEECRQIIAAYTDRAGATGQVSVQKPDPNGKLQPWGVDNMEGAGVEFNDFLFDKSVVTPAKKAPTKKASSLAKKHYNNRDTYLTDDLMTAWTRKRLEAVFRKDRGRVSKEVWPGGKGLAWVEVKYVFPDKSWLFVGYSEDFENLGGGKATWRIADVFPPSEAR